MKTCKKCNRSKPTSEFYNRNDTPDGLQHSCKSCERSRKRLRQKSGLEAPCTEMTPEQKKIVYTRAIAVMVANGIASKTTAKEMLERVGA